MQKMQTTRTQIEREREREREHKVHQNNVFPISEQCIAKARNATIRQTLQKMLRVETNLAKWGIFFTMRRQMILSMSQP